MLDCGLQRMQGSIFGEAGDHVHSPAIQTGLELVSDDEPAEVPGVGEMRPSDPVS